MTKPIENGETSGPLLAVLPAPSDVASRRTLTKRLHGHTTSPRSLPQGVFDGLDDLRDEMLRMRRHVTADVEALNVLAARLKSEDEEHAQALRKAHREGSATSAEDRRTPPDQRAAERAGLEERLWAGVDVLAEVADRVIELVREREDEWLADLRMRLEPVREKRREAERLLAEAKSEEYRLHRLGQWLMTTADDQAFGRQPAPDGEALPANLSPEVLKDSLERPWHKAKPWNSATTEVAA